MHVFMAIYIVP